MRKFWITFRIPTLIMIKASIDGDTVVEMPNGYKLDENYLKIVKSSITAKINEEIRLAGGRETLDSAKCFILACIELED